MNITEIRQLLEEAMLTATIEPNPLRRHVILLGAVSKATMELSLLEIEAKRLECVA